MRKNRIGLKVITALIVLTIGIGISACEKKERPISKDQIEAVEIVRVESGSLAPTLSAKTEVMKSSAFLVYSNKKGEFKPEVAENERVKKGDVLGSIGNEEVIAPADGEVLSICREVDVPKNYPLLEISYIGFSLDVEATDFLNSVESIDTLKAKFQIQDGIGPEEIVAVVPSRESPRVLQCLINHESDVRMGQFATVVITSEVKEKVKLLPLSVVAGRLKKGVVTKIVDGKPQDVSVELGATDGAFIEILSGVEVGDEIRSPAPNLDPRDK